MIVKKFDAEKFYTDFRTGLFGAGWQEHDVAVNHEHVEALEATVEAALNVAGTRPEEAKGWVVAVEVEGALRVYGPQYRSWESANQDAELSRRRGVRAEVWICSAADQNISTKE